METNQSKFGALQIGIIILTLATALIHVSLLFPNVLFILNALGYLTLLAAFFLPIDMLRERHNLVRRAFIAFTECDSPTSPIKKVSTITLFCHPLIIPVLSPAVRRGSHHPHCWIIFPITRCWSWMKAMSVFPRSGACTFRWRTSWPRWRRW